MEAVDTKMNFMEWEEQDTDPPPPRGGYRFDLECQNDQNYFLEEVTKSWCKRTAGPGVVHTSQTWLETLDSTKKKRNGEGCLLWK